MQRFKFIRDYFADQRLLFITVCVLSVFRSHPSQAEFHGTLTLTTNNADRWFSKSNHSVAGIANVDYEHPMGLYMGSSASNVDFDTHGRAHDSAQVEVTPYAGWSFALPEQWRVDLQWTGYLYDGKVFGHDADYHEFYLFMHFRDYVTGRIAATHDYYGLGDYAVDYALTGRYPITDALKLSGTLGYSQTQVALGSDYPYWNVSLVYAYQMMSFALRYMDSAETNINPVTESIKHPLYDPPVLDAACVFSMSAGF